jgi:hypothetical protein
MQISGTEIPVSVLRHFEVEIGTIPKEHLKQIDDITNWARSKHNNPSNDDIINEIHKVEQRIGMANDQRRFTKVWQFCKMQNCINHVRG